MNDEMEQLFGRALALAPDVRVAFVAQACRSDPRMREELASLLEHAGAGEEFFDALAGAVFSPSSVLAQKESQADPMVGRTIGRYRILSHIASGGMGAVYRAHDSRLVREVALKFLPPHVGATADAAERLLVEARAAAALQHPNVCTIHEIGETDDGRPFIAMAFYEGETLKQRLRRGASPGRGSGGDRRTGGPRSGGGARARDHPPRREARQRHAHA